MLQQFEVYGGRIINTTGRHFRYVSGTSASGNVGMVVLVDNVPQGVYYPGDAIEYPIDYGRWEVRGLQSDLVATVSIGAGKVASQRLDGTVTVNGGMVNAISEATNDLYAGRAYVGTANVETAAAGCWPLVQLWNPPTSTRRLLVDSMWVRIGADTIEALNVQRDGAALATPTGTVLPVKLDTTGPTSQAVVLEKSNLAAASAGVLLNGDMLLRWRGKSDQAVPAIEFQRPVMLRPGEGITVGVRSQDKGVQAQWQWREVAL